MSKATIATVKSFIRKNRDSLLLSVKGEFDGMTDCVQFSGDRSFRPATPADRVFDNNQGIRGVWFVLRSRDYIQAFERDGLRGFSVSNCCGSFDIAVAA